MPKLTKYVIIFYYLSKGCVNVNNTKLEEFFNGFKLGELLHRNELNKEKEEKSKLCTALIIITTIAIVTVAIIALCKYFKRRPIEEFEYDFDDDFDDTFTIDEDAIDEDEEDFVIVESIEAVTEE